MSATTPDVPLHPHTDRWVFRSGGESGRVSRAERRGVYGDDEARRACADAGEKPDRPWHRTTSSSRILTLRSRRVKAFLSLGEFAHDATAGIFNDYVALQVWAGTPATRLAALLGRAPGSPRPLQKTNAQAVCFLSPLTAPAATCSEVMRLPVRRAERKLRRCEISKQSWGPRPHDQENAPVNERRVRRVETRSG